jgi:hypothetical protein
MTVPVTWSIPRIVRSPRLHGRSVGLDAAAGFEEGDSLIEFVVVL